jgi:hypothetical protein
MDAITIKSLITKTMTALDTALTNPSPNYSVSGPDGAQSISFADYIKMLQDQIKGLQELLLIAEPYMIESRIIV